MFLIAFFLAPAVDKPPRTEEQSVIQRNYSNKTQLTQNVTEIMDYTVDVSPKALKILAKICVDELNEMKRCNEAEIEAKKALAAADAIENEVITCNSSDSETDASSIRSSQKGVITGGARKASSSESQSSSESDSSSDSSDTDDSDEDDDTDDDDNNSNKSDNDSKSMTILKSNEPQNECNEPQKECNEIIKNRIKQQIVDDWSSDSNSCDELPSMKNSVEHNENVDSSTENVDSTIENVDSTIENIDSTIENQVMEINEPNEVQVYNPTALKELCKEVLHAHSMIIQYEVPSLRYLCEHTLASAGMEIPLICFVPQDEEYMTEDQPSNDDEGVYLCLDGEFDETELANLFSGEVRHESIEMNAIEPKECATDNSSFIDQCVALQNILSSPSPEHNKTDESLEFQSTDYTEFYLDPNGFYDSIQYEETVLPSESQDDTSAAIAKLKKYLQNKYVHPLSYHKMFAINKLLRKYKVHHLAFSNKKSMVEKKMQKRLTKLRQRAKQHCKPKKLATRRSARIADKIKQKTDETNCKGKKTKKPKKCTKIENNKIDTLDKRRLCKIMNVNDFIQHSVNKKKETDKESITRDLLKLIAKKRTLKRKLSICQRPTFTLDEDGYCYDEDGQISEMLSSFINNSIDDGRSERVKVKKPRSRKPSIDGGKAAKEQDTKKKVPPITLKKSIISEGQSEKIVQKDKVKKSKSKTKNSTTKLNEAKEQVLTMTDDFSVNKTEKKCVSSGTPLTFPTKASVKEIIPAKRTRFLSIDGSLMRYGAKRSYNQMKSLQENAESPEMMKRKVPTQKQLKSNDVTKKDAQKVKRNKEKLEIAGECRKSSADDLKEILKSTLKCGQSEKNISEKIQNNSEKYRIPTKVKEHSDVKETPEPVKNIKESPAESSVKPEFSAESSVKAVSPESSVKSVEMPISKTPKRTRFSDRVISLDQPAIVTESKVEKPKYIAADSTQDSMDINKFTIKKAEKPLSERSLCSTMVSPLKIIIEPKRLQSPSQTPSSHDEYVPEPVKHKTNPFSLPNSATKQSVEKRDIQKPTRFSERITNLIVNPLNSDCSKSPSIQNEHITTFLSENNNGKALEKNVIRANRETVNRTVSTSISTTTQEQQTMYTNPDTNSMNKSVEDIEQFLPTTKNLQPKPGKRCMARAQTISHSISSLNNNNLYEPMQLRSSNNYWTRRRFDQPRDYGNNQYQRNFPYKPRESPSAFYKETLTSATNSGSPPMAYPLKTGNNAVKNGAAAATPPQKNTIDISSFPDPETLQIPSLDLRKPRFGRSHLTLPVPPIPSSIPAPIRVPPSDNKDITTGM